MARSGVSPKERPRGGPLHISHAGLDLTGRRLDFCLLDGERAQERLERGAVAGDGRREEPLGVRYSGHEVSRWALSTVSSRSSSAACASKSASGMSGPWCMQNVYRLPSPCAMTRECAGASSPGAGSETKSTTPVAGFASTRSGRRSPLARVTTQAPLSGAIAFANSRLPRRAGARRRRRRRGALGRGPDLDGGGVGSHDQVGLRAPASCDRGARTGRVNSRVGTTRCASAAVVVFNSLFN